MGSRLQLRALFAVLATLALVVTCLPHGTTASMQEESIMKRDARAAETFDEKLEDIKRLVKAINVSCEDKLATSTKLQFEKDVEMVQLKNELHEMKQQLSILSTTGVNDTNQATTTQTIDTNQPVYAVPLKAAQKKPSKDREMMQHNQELLEEVLSAFNETKQQLTLHENLLLQIELDLQTDKDNMVKHGLEAITMSHQLANLKASVDDLEQAYSKVVMAVNETASNLNQVEDAVDILKRRQNRLQLDSENLKSEVKQGKMSTSSRLLHDKKLQDLVDLVDVIAYKTNNLDNKVNNMSELCNLDVVVKNSVNSQNSQSGLPSWTAAGNQGQQVPQTCGCAKEIDDLQNQLNSTSSSAASHDSTLALVQQKVNEVNVLQDKLNSTVSNLASDVTNSKQATARGLFSVSSELVRLEKELNTTTVKSGLNKVQQQLVGMNTTLMALKTKVDSVESQVVQQKGAVAIATQNANVALFESKTTSTALEKLRKVVAAYHANKQVQCVADKCAGGYSLNPFSKTCYKQFDMNKNWQDAQNYCKGQGGNLATFATKQSADWVFSQRRSHNAGFNENESSWIGGKRTSRGGAFRWVGLTQGSITYSAWAPGMPDRNYELCLEILDTEGFNDGECDWTHRDFICEKRATC